MTKPLHTRPYAAVPKRKTMISVPTDKPCRICYRPMYLIRKDVWECPTHGVRGMGA